MALEITGKLMQVLPEQTGTGKNGTWVKQEFVLGTEEQFPRRICFSLWGDKVQALKSFQPGTAMKVSFNLESREYNGRWYTDARAWKIESMESSEAPSSEETVDFVPDPIPPDVESKDDLPF